MKAAEAKTAATSAKRNNAFSSKESGDNFFAKDAQQDSFFSESFIEHSPVQRKLTVGKADDPYEREADAMAGKVVQRLSNNNVNGIPVQRKTAHTNDGISVIQNKCSACEQEEKLQTKEDENKAEEAVQLKPIFESNAEPTDDENNIQRKNKVQRKSGAEEETASSDIENRINASKGSGAALPDETRGQMEDSFSADFSNVRIHNDSASAQMSDDLEAQAFTHGNDIYFSEGKYDTKSSAGKELLAHELTHTIQQGESPQENLNLQPQDETDINQPTAPPAAIPQQNASSDPGNDPTASPVSQDPAMSTRDVISQQPLTSPVQQGTSPGATNNAIVSNQQPVSVGAIGNDNTNDLVSATGAGGAPAVQNADPAITPQLQSTQAAVPTTTPDLTGGDPGLLAFVQEISSEQLSLLSDADQHKAEMIMFAETLKQNVIGSIETEALLLESTYDQAINQVLQAASNNATTILTDRDQKIAATQTNADTESGNLLRMIGEKAQRIVTSSEADAIAAEREGETQAQRALSDSRTKATEAVAIGERKVAQYRSYNRAARIATVAREMASEMVHSLLQVGERIAAAVRKDAGQLAAKFRKEGTEALEYIFETQIKAQEKIDTERDETIDGLNKMIDDPIRQIQTSANDLVTKLVEEKQTVTQQIRQSALPVCAMIDERVVEACNLIDKETSDALVSLDDFATDFSQIERSAEQIAEARQQLDIYSNEFDAAMAGLVDGVEQYMEQEANTAVTSTCDNANQLINPITQTGVQFEANTVSSTTGVIQQMNDAVTESTADMHTAVTDTERELQQAVEQSVTEWQQELDEGIAEMRKKVDDGIAEMAGSLAGLAGKIDDKAEEIENESILSRIASWVGGIIVGFFGALWDLVKILLLIVLVILAVILVIAALILIIGGLAALLEVIAAVAAFITAFASVIGIIMEVLGVIGIVIGIAFAIYYIYLSITRDDLSDYERGKLAGRGIFEAVFAIFGGKIFAQLGKWVKGLGRGGEIAGEASKLAKLRSIITDEAQLERILARFGNSAERVETIIATFGNNAGRLEIALSSFGQDAAKLEGMLANFGNDAARLEAVLGQFGTDGARLEAALGSFGNDVSRLETALGHFGSDGARLEAALGSFGNNATRLETALGHFGNDGARLEAALGSFGNDATRLETVLGHFGNDAARLETVLGHFGNDAVRLERALGHFANDATKLESTLSKCSNNAEQVERLLGLTGNDGARLDNMLDHVGDANDLERFLNNGNPIWEGQFGPAPTEAAQAADFATANGGAAQPGYAGNRPYGNNGRDVQDMILPRKDAAGNPINYTEYDIHPRIPGVNRGAERVVLGGGNRYYTNTHYRSFTKF